MSVSTEQDQALAWVKERWLDGGSACEGCGMKDWGVGEPLRVRAAEDSQVMPLVPVICQHCGNTRLLNMVVMKNGGFA